MTRESIELKVNLLTMDNDIDLRNELVDEAIISTEFFDEDKTATDIEYEVIKCERNGDAVIKATFEYE